MSPTVQLTSTPSPPSSVLRNVSATWVPKGCSSPSDGPRTRGTALQSPTSPAARHKEAKGQSARGSACACHSIPKKQSIIPAVRTAVAYEECTRPRSRTSLPVKSTHRHERYRSPPDGHRGHAQQPGHDRRSGRVVRLQPLTRRRAAGEHGQAKSVPLGAVYVAQPQTAKSTPVGLGGGRGPPPTRSPPHPTGGDPPHSAATNADWSRPGRLTSRRQQSGYSPPPRPRGSPASRLARGPPGWGSRRC